MLRLPLAEAAPAPSADWGALSTTPVRPHGHRYAREARRVLRRGGRFLFRACLSAAGVPNDIDQSAIEHVFAGWQLTQHHPAGHRFGHQADARSYRTARAPRLTGQSHGPPLTQDGGCGSVCLSQPERRAPVRLRRAFGSAAISYRTVSMAGWGGRAVPGGAVLDEAQDAVAGRVEAIAEPEWPGQWVSGLEIDRDPWVAAGMRLGQRGGDKGVADAFPARRAGWRWADKAGRPGTGGVPVRSARW